MLCAPTRCLIITARVLLQTLDIPFYKVQTRDNFVRICFRDDVFISVYAILVVKCRYIRNSKTIYHAKTSMQIKYPLASSFDIVKLGLRGVNICFWFLTHRLYVLGITTTYRQFIKG